MSAPLHGGCQCGAVRFSAETDRRDAELCHCAMCRRAVGNIHMTAVSVPNATVRWQGEPRTYASSPIAKRGFCGACGTPLFFAYNDSPSVDLMVGAIDETAELRPANHFGVESRLDAFRHLDGLPEQRTGDVPTIVARWIGATGRFPGEQRTS